jgi:hypothetical protein
VRLDLFLVAGLTWFNELTALLYRPLFEFVIFADGYKDAGDLDMRQADRAVCLMKLPSSFARL